LGLFKKKQKKVKEDEEEEKEEIAKRIQIRQKVVSKMKPKKIIKIPKRADKSK
jgi:hypothetical protein